MFLISLMTALECIEGNEAQVPLYRGQDKVYGKDVTVGDSLAWDSFTSVSTEEGVARGVPTVHESIGECCVDWGYTHAHRDCVMQALLVEGCCSRSMVFLTLSELASHDSLISPVRYSH